MLGNHPVNFSGHGHFGSGNIMVFDLSNDLVKPRERRKVELYGKFIGHIYRGNGDIMFMT